MVKASKGNGLKCLFYHATWGNCSIFANDGALFFANDGAFLNAHCISDGKESRI